MVFMLTLACGQPAADQGAIPVAEPRAASGAIALTDIAGTWRVKNMNEAGDSLAVYTLVITADTTGWIGLLPGRDPVRVRVSAIAGDNVVTETGPYESVLRPGVQVTARSVVRFQGNSSTGTFVSRYATAGGDSVLRGRSIGTRIN